MKKGLKWKLIAGSALVSSLFICGGCKLGESFADLKEKYDWDACVTYYANSVGADDTFKADGQFENTQGVKVMPFGFGHNVFAKFPEEGYSDMIGTVSVPGHQYDAAFSADWPAERYLRIRGQIIDKYMGNLSILFAFRDENTVSVRMEKAAEAFLKEYSGLINATA